MGVECARVGTAAGIGIDEGHMAEGAGKLMNLTLLKFMSLRSVIGGIAEIVKAVLDECFAFLHPKTPKLFALNQKSMTPEMVREGRVVDS